MHNQFISDEGCRHATRLAILIEELMTALAFFILGLVPCVVVHVCDSMLVLLFC